MDHADKEKPMKREARIVTMKDGRSCLLRPVRPEDAAGLLNYLKQSTRETPYLLRTPEEADALTMEMEERFVERMTQSENELMLVAEVEGQVAGNCQITFSPRAKTRHRATIGIALLKPYWAQGIGTAMFEELLDEARRREGVTQVELEFVEGNSRARALYEKMGFRVVGLHPDALRQPDGTLVNNYLMMLKL